MATDTAAAATDMKKVKLQSSDNESFDVDQDVVSVVYPILYTDCHCM